MDPDKSQNHLRRYVGFPRKGGHFVQVVKIRLRPVAADYLCPPMAVPTGKIWMKKVRKVCLRSPGAASRVTVAPSKPEVVYALIESNRSALFRSDDGGKTWQERDRSNWNGVGGRSISGTLIVDPKNENKIYKTRPCTDHERRWRQKF